MDNNLPDLKPNETVQEDLSSLEKLTQSYLLLKKKIYGIDELIKQYNNKLKECERLKSDLDAANKQTKKVTYNYNTTLAKVIKLEIQSTEYKKNIESLTTQVNDHKIKAAADQQHIQQLVCKIKDLEGNESDKIMEYDLEKSLLQTKIKELEQELRNVKRSYDTKIKKIEKKIPTETDNKAKSKDVGINTVLVNDVVMQKPEVIEKCTITDEVYNVRNDVYPIFCNKCEVLLEPPPLEKICNIMVNSCPKLIEKISSPKKILPSPKIPTEINSEQCNPRKSTTLPDASPLHLQNQNNHTDFISANLFSPHQALTSNYADYCNNFIPKHNLMNQSTYYIGPTPINPTPLINLNTPNHNNSSESTMASSLSIISSLQKRIDTLETKIKKLNKKKLSKKKLKESSSCWQQHHPSTCMHEMSNSIHLNFMELWKRMADVYDNKEKERFNVYRHSGKKLKKNKLSRSKPTKRLRSAHTESWKVESVSKKVDETLKKRPKRRKCHYSSHLSKFDISLNNSKDLENSNSDFDTNDIFNDSINRKTDTNMESTSSSCIKMSKSILKPTQIVKTSMHSVQTTDTDECEPAEPLPNSVEYNKSVSGETDSGILSDSVESGKFIHQETDMDVCLDAIECENTVKVKSSVGNKSCMIESMKPFVKSKLSETSVIKSISCSPKCNEGMETSTGSKALSQPNEDIKTIEEKKLVEVSECDDVTIQAESCTYARTNSTKKRKISEPRQLKNRNSRQILLKKLRNLKRSAKVLNNTNHNIFNQQVIQNSENENLHISKEQKDLNYIASDANTEDYVPKKRSRVAHIPKSTITDSTKSLNLSFQTEKCLEKNVENTEIVSQIASVNSTNNQNAITQQTKVQKNDTTLNELKDIFNHQDIQNSDGENLRICQEQKNLEHDTNDVNTDDCISKEKSRVSQKSSLQFGNSLQQNVENTEAVSQIVSVNGANNQNAITQQTKIQKNDITLNEFKQTGTERMKQLKPAFPDIVNCNIENSKENNDEITAPQLENKLISETLPNKDTESYSNINAFSESDVNNSLRKVIESKIELGNQCEYLRHEDNNKSSPTQNIQNLIEHGEHIEQQINAPVEKNLDIHENIEKKSFSLDACSSHNESSVKTLNVPILKNDTDICNQDIVSNTHSNSSNNSLVNTKDEDFVDVQESIAKGSNTEKVGKSSCLMQTNSNKEYQLKSFYPITLLKRYINKKECSNKNYKNHCQKIGQVDLVLDKFIKKQLQRLIEDNNWQTSLHWDVIEKLKSICSARIVAKGIVEYLCSKQGNQRLDKSYTPPAPLMTKTQQKLAALLFDLEEAMPMVFQFVQAGIEYKLFRLNQTIERSNIELLARMYTVLARIKKDREKVRIFCCDALYCLGLNAIIVLYVVFTCWPEVFPNNETNTRLLPKCLAHIIMIQQAVNYPKLNALKNLISIFYKYPKGTLSKDLLNEFLIALQEKSHTEVETAVILLAKREGTHWAYKNIIQTALLPLIINKKLPSMYRAFWLLGNLMRTFPIEDKDNSVSQIVEQLSDLINSGEGSDEQNEGVISALLSLSRHKFDEVVLNTLKWKPTVPLRNRTEEQFSGVFNQRSIDFWKHYLQRSKHQLKIHREIGT